MGRKFENQLDNSSKKLENFFSPLVFKRSSTGNLSVSVLFLDSMSRSLAFRSLPRTIKFLQKLAKNSKRKVFDFKLFQSIADSTYWHLSNLFDGPKATAQNKFFYIEKSANFFRKFKQEGQSLVFCPFYSKMFYFCYFKQAGNGSSRRPAKRPKRTKFIKYGKVRQIYSFIQLLNFPITLRLKVLKN